MVYPQHIHRYFLLALFPIGAVHAQVFNADAEPNDHFQDATTIALGTPFEGQLNIGPNDVADIYSFTLPNDGVLLLQVEAEQDGAGTNELYLRGYALEDSTAIMVPLAGTTLGIDGTPLLGNTEVSCMKAGQHYLRISQLEIGTPTTLPISYRITATHRPMAFANDAEPNNIPSEAIELYEDAWTEGRTSVEWPYNDAADQFDFYRIEKSGNDPLVLNTAVAAEFTNDPVEPFNFDILNADLEVISDIHGRVDMGSNGVPLVDHAYYPNTTEPGTYYVRILNPTWYGACYAFSWSSLFVGVEGTTGTPSLQVIADPTSGCVRITAADCDRVEILDAQGRLVTVLNMRGSDTITWDPKGHAAGACVARAILRQGDVHTARFVLAR